MTPAPAPGAPTASGAHLARLAELSADLLATLHPTGEVAWCNGAWRRAADTVPWPQGLHPDERVAGQAALERVVLDGAATVEARVADPAGGFRWVEFALVADAPEREVHVSGRDVTARRAGEAAARTSEARFAAVAGSTADAIVSADAHGRITFWNAAAARIFGWTADEVLGRPLTVLMPERYRRRHRAGLARLGAGGQPRVVGRTVEIEGLRRDGSEFPLELSLGAIPEADGGAFTAVIRDVSREVAERQQLRQAEERFSEAFDGAAMGLALVLPSGTILRANQALCDLVGRPGGSLDGTPFPHLLHRDDRDEHRVELQEMLAGRTRRWADDLRCVRDGGEVVHVRTHVSLIRSADGLPMHFVVTLEDITERRRVLEALAMSETRHRTLLANLPDTVVCLFDADLRFAVVEGRALEAIGLSAQDLEGRTLAEFTRPERLADVEPHYRAALFGESRTFDWEIRDVVWWVQVVPLYDDAGQIVGGMSVSRDITARKAAERALEDRARELERSNAELEQFAYVASHDLSEPLRMVTSYLQLLQRRHGDALPPGADQYIEVAVDGARRMRELIEDLLAYSRVGRSEVPRQEVDVCALVSDVARTLTAADRDALPAPVIEVGDLPRVTADTRELGQLFQNLISNALKFVPEGRAPRVEISAERDGDAPGWVFTVADNGIGVEEQHRDRIFRMFQRLHGRDDYSGTGVGLAIARKVVEHHGGRIWVEAGPDGGSRFRFELPEEPR